MCVVPVTAAYLIACTNAFTLCETGKQLACYCGVVPFEYQSGISIKGKHRVHKMANCDQCHTKQTCITCLCCCKEWETVC
ncbi:MAG: IS110 family transposase [Sphingobacteriales bacterium]|nr:IS110 family transposase [Sphingobacteriales bacterium]